MKGIQVEGNTSKSVKDVSEGGPLARNSVALRPKIGEVGLGNRCQSLILVRFNSGSFKEPFKDFKLRSFMIRFELIKTEQVFLEVTA